MSRHNDAIKTGIPDIRVLPDVRPRNCSGYCSGKIWPGQEYYRRLFDDKLNLCIPCGEMLLDEHKQSIESNRIGSAAAAKINSQREDDITRMERKAAILRGDILG